MRLWGRWWLGLFAVAIAAVASGPAESALGAGAPPVRASAEAITVLAPDSPAQGSGLVMAFGPALPGGAYHYPHPHGVIHAGWAKATAAKQTGASPTATATSLVRRVRVFGGAVQARKIWVSVSLVPGTAQATGAVQGLVVLGRHVHAVAGKTLALAHWGTLDVLASQQSQAPGSATAAITGLRLTLLQDHGGLAAGTVVELGSANAVIAPAPLRTPPPGGGTTTPSAPQRTHGATLHPRPTAPATPPQTPPAGHPTHHPAHHPAHHPPAQRRHRSAGTVPPQSSHALIAAARGGRARVLAAALAQVGWPYIWGGDSRSDGGFDCSGLVDYAYARAGLTLPGRPTAAVLWQMSAPVTRARLQPGDLAFLYSRTRAPYHVALYVGDGLMVVAPHTGAKVQLVPLDSVPWDGYGRLLQGGRGDGLAASVAAAARRFAHPGPGESRRLAAGRAADALAALRVQIDNPHLGPAPATAPTRSATAAIVPAPGLVPLASVRPAQAEGAGRVLGFALLMLLVAACLVWVPIRAIRAPNR